MRPAVSRSGDETGAKESEPLVSADAGRVGAGAAEGALSEPVAARLGQLAHDLRNPLNSIAMNTELLVLLADGNAGPEFGESLGALGRAVEELGSRLSMLDDYVGGLPRTGPEAVSRPASGGVGGEPR